EFGRLFVCGAGGWGGALPGVLTDRGGVNLAPAVKIGYTPQLTMQGIIDEFDRLRPALERVAADGKAVPLDAVRLLPPLPRPGKNFARLAHYLEHAPAHAPPLQQVHK